MDVLSISMKPRVPQSCSSGRRYAPKKTRTKPERRHTQQRWKPRSAHRRKTGQRNGAIISSQKGKGMEPFVRRSHLLVSAQDEAQVDMSWRHTADAVILDLAETVPDVEKPQARANIKAAISVAACGGAEVFVRINKELADADIMASAWPGLTGVV